MILRPGADQLFVAVDRIAVGHAGDPGKSGPHQSLDRSDRPAVREQRGGGAAIGAGRGS
jgi:hypothetical protein